MYIVTLGALNLVLGVALNGPVKSTEKMSKQLEFISMQDAIKAATKMIGDYVISTDLFTDKGGVTYYRNTVVDTEGEVKDVYVGSKSGKVRQVIEHPAEMRPPSPVEKCGFGHLGEGSPPEGRNSKRLNGKASDPNCLSIVPGEAQFFGQSTVWGVRTKPA